MKHRSGCPVILSGATERQSRGRKDFGGFLRWLAFAAALSAFSTRPTLAQEAGPRTDALLARAEQGDKAALHDAESLAWQWIKLVADKGNLDPVSARAMARTMLLLEGPLPPIETPPAAKERVWRSAGVNALEMALAQDSGDVWSASQLERIATYPYIWMNPDEELRVLRALIARHVDLAAPLLLSRIRLELERGSADSAAVWLASVPASAISPAARGHLAAEVAFALRKDADGATMYYEGATAIRDSADAAWYTRDLAWIAQPDELTEWNALAPAAREAWLEKFWNRRDIEDGQLPGTRLPEQFRRWRIALRDYRWEYDGSTARGMIIPHSDGVEYRKGADAASGDIRFPKDPVVSELAYLNRMRPLTLVLDDRGGLELRHGDPAQRVHMPGITALSEETLLWNTPSGPLVVSFSRMVDSVFEGPLAGVPSQRFGMVARNYPAGDLNANCEVYPQLCPLAGQVLIDGLPPHTGPSALTLATATTILRDFTRMRTEAEHTDGNPETFTNDLQATVQAYGIPDVGTLVVFAVPTKGLIADAKRRAETIAFAARLRVVAGDSARGEFAGVVDTVRSWKLAAPPGDSTQLTGFLLVPTPPGNWSVAVVLSDLARVAGTGQRIGSVPVVAFDGKTLRLGDPILGSPTSGLTWTHDGDQIPLNPRNAWRPDEPAILSYQVDGLVIGHAYETHIEVWDAGGSPKTFRTSMAFTTAATTTRMSLQRELSLRELTAGDYRIVLRVRDTVTGTEVTRDRKLGGTKVRTFVGIFFLYGALAADAAAQTPAERSMLTGWADSLQGVADAPALAAYDGLSRQGAGRAGDLRRALYQVRHADLTDNRGEIELVLTNMQVMTNHANWAWPYYVLALAFDAMARKEWVETLSDGKQLAEKHSDATWRTLRMALDRDPAFPLARRLLGTLTAAGGDRFLRPDQVVALAREARQPSPEPDALLAWGRHLRTVQDYDEALKTFDRSAARGGDASVLQLERARTLLALGDSTAATAAYWAGVTQLTAAGRQAYRTDLWWIAEPETLTAFDETPDGAIGSWLHRFWNARDAEAANHAGDRLTEHLRRWVVVYQRYRALSPWTDAFWSRVEMKFDQAQCQDTDAKMFEALWRVPPTFEGDIRIHEPIIDHRGMIYLRHGEPVRRIANKTFGGFVRRRTMAEPYDGGATALGPTGVHLPWSIRAAGEVPATVTGPSNETWLYWFDGELHLLSFRGSEALGHYSATTLTETLPAILMSDHALAASLDIKEFYAMARRMAGNDTSIWGGGASATQASHRDNPNCFNEVRAAVTRMSRDESASINRDSDTPPGFRGQNSVGLTFALGTAAEKSNTVLETFAIPAAALQATHTEDGLLAYAVTLRIVAYDRGADQTIELDTTRQFAVNRSLLSNEYLTGVTEFAVPAGNWQVATRMIQPDGTVVLQDLHQVRVDAGSGISLSDIVTGRPGTPPWTATDGATFPINYPNGWYSGETAELFYEVRGVPVGATYRSTVEVRPAEGKGTRPIQIQSTDRATGAVSYVRKTLGLDQLVPGKYRLILTVESGELKASRERLITIVERK